MSRSQNALKHTPAAIVAPPALAVSVIVWAALAAAGVSLLLAILLAAAAGLPIGALLWLKAPQSALGALRARPAVRGDHPRLENLVEGLCTTHGFRKPSVHVVETSAINVAAVGLNRPAAHLVVTRGALSSLDRLELEAVVARQLCAMKRGVAFPTVLASVARLPGTGRFTKRVAVRTCGFDRVVAVDIEAVRLTSFPTGLASALKKAADGPDVDASDAVAHLWLVAPRKAPSAARAQTETIQRIDLLGEI